MAATSGRSSLTRSTTTRPGEHSETTQESIDLAWIWHELGIVRVAYRHIPVDYAALTRTLGQRTSRNTPQVMTPSTGFRWTRRGSRSTPRTAIEPRFRRSLPSSMADV